MAPAIIWKDAPNSYVSVAYVGVCRVGMIQRPVPENISKDTYFSILLPDVDGSDEGWRRTEAEARRIVERAAAKWFARTGLLTPLLAPKTAPQDESNNKTPVAVWVQLRQLMDAHPDARIVTDGSDHQDIGGIHELYSVIYTEKTNTIELVFD